jgi:hypothetical protein
MHLPVPVLLRQKVPRLASILRSDLPVAFWHRSCHPMLWCGIRPGIALAAREHHRRLMLRELQVSIEAHELDAALTQRT